MSRRYCFLLYERTKENKKFWEKSFHQCGVLSTLVIREAVMESLRIIRDHLKNNETSCITDINVFVTILDDIEKQLNADLKESNNELHYDQHIAQCIDLEGRNVIGENR